MVAAKKVEQTIKQRQGFINKKNWVTHFFQFTKFSKGKRIKLKCISRIADILGIFWDYHTDAEFGSTVKLCGVSPGMSESVRTLKDSSGPGPFCGTEYYINE